MSFCPVPLNGAPFFEIDTHDPTTLGSANADSTPTWTSFKAGNTAVQSDQNFTNRTTGEYYASCTFSAANGYAVGDYIILRAKATVGGITARKSWHFWVCPAEVSFGVGPANATHAANTAWNSGAIGAATLATDTLNASKVAADVAAEFQSGLATAASIAALNNLSAAQVNAEVLDVLTVDTFAEPGQGVPPATTSLKNKIGYLYKFLRNKLTQTESTLKVYADDGTTVDHKATTTDDATTYTRGPISSGP